ncbi:LamG-like jellyroll fold domain-containing protein [Rhodoflexus sp.]
MKRINIVFAVAALFMGCTDGYIDRIERVEPGVDTQPPVVNINYPIEGTLIRVLEDVTSININFEVTDDIEISSIAVRLNGTQIASFNHFRDYRRAIKSVPFANLGNGKHILSVVATDLSGKSTTKTVNFEKVPPYRPVYTGEVFYVPFDGDNMELVSITNPLVTGSPSFTNGLKGRAYLGANNAFLTFPTNRIRNPEFTAIFWYKLDATPDRAGILTMSPPDPARPNNMNNRESGFRLFRENAGGKQRIKLNVGNGSGDNWFDGGANADIDPASGDWVHIAFSLSRTQGTVYLNGRIVSQGNFPGVSWNGTDILTIGSGAPRFTEWGHLSDRSAIDELRIFNRALTQAEIQSIINKERP